VDGKILIRDYAGHTEYRDDDLGVYFALGSVDGSMASAVFGGLHFEILPCECSGVVPGPAQRSDSWLPSLLVDLGCRHHALPRHLRLATGPVGSAYAEYETITGVALLVAPALPASLPLGAPLDAPVGMAVARVAGAALLSLGLACWLVIHDSESRPGRAVVAAMLLYNVAVGAILAQASLGQGATGFCCGRPRDCTRRWPAGALPASGRLLSAEGTDRQPDRQLFFFPRRWIFCRGPRCQLKSGLSSKPSIQPGSGVPAGPAAARPTSADTLKGWWPILRIFPT
jgi:hypothetical protein